VSISIEAAEEGASSEADSLTAWEEYQLNGVHVAGSTIDDMFTEALADCR
jgi:hypothetical protein